MELASFLIGIAAGVVVMLWAEWAIFHKNHSEAVTRWLVRRREAALEDWAEHARLSRLLAGAPVGAHADHFARKSRRRLRRWDWALDAWTLNGRR